LCLKKTDKFGFDEQVKQGHPVLLLLGLAGAEESLVHDCIQGLLARSCEKRNNRPEKWWQPALVRAQAAVAKTAGFYRIFLLY
jgi:hypothetical protein